MLTITPLHIFIFKVLVICGLGGYQTGLKQKASIDTAAEKMLSLHCCLLHYLQQELSFTRHPQATHSTAIHRVNELAHTASRSQTDVFFTEVRALVTEGCEENGFDSLQIFRAVQNVLS